MTENEFLLEDRLQKIQQIIGKYGEENFAISFSGGKDSTVLHHLIDMALPENKIPRVYADTGIELGMIRNFVLDLQKHDDRIQIIKPSTPIKPMLERDGYPFKSKKHAALVATYQKYKTTEGRAGIQHYLHINTDGINWASQNSCPAILKYQFTPEFQMKISDLCCKRMKEEPLDKWQKENNKPYAIIGIMASEAGRRMNAKCLAFRAKKFKAFQPLAPMTKEWEDWFIEEYKINICDIYKPPYNFYRTGCKGCPFAVNLQQELDTLEKFFPAERKQCEFIWKPVYDEYRRLGYRLKKPYEPKADVFENDGEQLTFFDYYKEDELYEGKRKDSI